MNATDDDLVARSLAKLARHAPPYEGLPVATPRSGRSRYLAPLLASACVVALTITFGVLLSRGDPEDTPTATSPGATSSPTDPSSGPTTGVTMRLEGAASWPQHQARSCASWTPTEEDAVVVLESLDDSCIVKAPRSSTTVLVGPQAGTALLGGEWDDVTTPWRVVDGHQLRRLSSGPLMEMSSRFVDALVCSSCDEVIVVLGPDPSTVRELIESVRG